MSSVQEIELGEFSGNLLAAIAVHFPEREAAILFSRPALQSRWTQTERLTTEGRRGFLFGFSGTDIPAAEDWYEPLLAAFGEVYCGLPQPQGERGVFNVEVPRAAGLPYVVVDSGGVAVWRCADAELF